MVACELQKSTRLTSNVNALTVRSVWVYRSNLGSRLGRQVRWGTKLPFTRVTLQEEV